MKHYIILLISLFLLANVHSELFAHAKPEQVQNFKIFNGEEDGQQLSFEIPSGSILDYGYNRLYVKITEPEPGGQDRITEQFVRNLIINRAPVVILEYTAVNPGEEIDLMDHIWIEDEGLVYTPGRKGSDIHYAFDYEWWIDRDSDNDVDADEIRIVENENVNAVFSFPDLSFNGMYIMVSVTDPHGKTSSAEALLFVMPTRYGYLKGDETWEPYNIDGVPGSMYAIIGDLYTLGYTLTVTEGVEIVVMGNYGIFIQENGTLNAGSESVGSNSIFRFRDDLATERQLYWKGIKAKDGGTINLSNVSVNGAERGVTIDELPGLPDTNAFIVNSTFENNLIGIHLLGKELTIDNCVFNYNKHYALKEDAGANFILIDCRFDRNGLPKPADDGLLYYYDYYDCQSRTVIRATEDAGGN